MCGITGILDFKGLREGDIKTAEAMTDLLDHRGPDDRGVFVSQGKPPKAVLGHTRLSIIDLSAAGHQPMSDPSERYWIVFNGEIYNFMELREGLQKKGFTFRSRSDTEVLLYLYIVYGAASLSMIEGMYAFAIWDELEHKLFLARDRVGKKPLFYSWDGQRFVFASELKAFWASPQIRPELNTQMLLSYLHLRYIPAPDTLFKNIYKLSPGFYASASVKGLTSHRYWDVQPDVLHKRVVTSDHLKGDLLSRFERSVEKRLIADVPIGVFLSGGLDSTSVVWSMSKQMGEKVKTYSVGFETPWESELKYARVAARAFNTDHHELIVTHSDYPAYLEDLVWFRDLPVSEPADVPIYRMSRLASEKVKVVLTGEGGDELLGGYYKYFLDPFTKYFRGLPSPLKSSCYWATQHLPFRLKKLLHYMKTSNIKDDAKRAMAWFSSMGDDQLLSNDFSHDLNLPEGIENRLDLLGFKGVNFMSYLDLKYWLPDNLLERADRLTMSNSIELRAPFLDQSFLEFCFTIPEHLKTGLISTKKIFREAMSEVLPREIVSRRKMGFPTPIGHWLKNELREWAESIIFSASCKNRGLFGQKTLRTKFDEHLLGKRDNSKIIWTVINLELWFRIFMDGNYVKRVRT